MDLIGAIKLSACKNGAYQGIYGLCIPIGPMESKFTIQQSDTGLAKYFARFSFDPNNIDLGGETLTIFSAGIPGERPIALKLDVLQKNSFYEIRLTGQSASTAPHATLWYPIANDVTIIELGFKTSDANQQNGSVSLYIDGTLIKTVSNIPNESVLVESIYFGQVSPQFYPLASGTFYLDYFESNSQEPIGP